MLGAKSANGAEDVVLSSSVNGPPRSSSRGRGIRFVDTTGAASRPGGLDTPVVISSSNEGIFVKDNFALLLSVAPLYGFGNEDSTEWVLGKRDVSLLFFIIHVIGMPEWPVGWWYGASEIEDEEDLHGSDEIGERQNGSYTGWTTIHQ